MKNLLYILPFLLLTAFYSSLSNTSTISEVKDAYIANLEAFYNNMETLEEMLDKGKDKKTIQHFKNTRLAFKKVEFLLAYLDPEFCSDHINGAPLPKLERKVANIVVKEPSGLQTLEEYMIEGEIASNKEKIKALCHDLKAHLKTFIDQQKIVPLQDRMILEAIRFEIIRINNMGLTGFDTPNSLNPIQESKIAIETCWENTQIYYGKLHDKSTPLVMTLDELYSNAISYLDKHDDFETFDRMHFLKTFINPIYESSLDLHLKLQVETVNLVTPMEQPINYFADNLFDEDFLNPNYYTIAKPKKEKEAIALGKLLFFDPILSRNNKRACASCHQPEKGFADGMAKSNAFDENGTLDRNAPGLINSVFSKGFFHDLRAARLEDQSEHVIFSKKEFNTNYKEITSKLNQSEAYKTMFKEAFPEMGRRAVSKYSISVALASYVRSLKAFNSPVDQYIRGERETIDQSVINGYNLFMGKAACGTCHFAPNFNGTVPPNYVNSETEVLGVTKTNDFENPELDEDLGRYNAGKLLEQADFNKHAFKTPSIRNIDLTGPYMHNGAYETLEEVMEFYNKGGGTGLGLDVPNQTLPFDSLSLTENEVNDIISFMKALTDTVGLTARPKHLPTFEVDSLNNRNTGGIY